MSKKTKILGLIIALSIALVSVMYIPKNLWENLRSLSLVPDSILSISGPTTIQRGGIYNVTITYDTSTNRDIVLELKKWDGVFYSDVRIPVTAGANQSVTVQIQVPQTVEVGVELNYFGFITSSGWTWSSNTTSGRQIGIYATLAERICRSWDS